MPSFNFQKRGTVTKKMVLKLEIYLLDSLLTPDEATSRLEYVIGAGNNEAFSSLIVMLLRETKSSMWDSKSLEIEEEK